MNKIITGVVIIVIIGLVGFFISTMEAPEPLEEDPIEIAQEWILDNATTYTQREGSNLEYVETTELGDGVYEVDFTFEAAFAGYGPVEEDEMAAQVITEHEIRVTVDNGEVVGAVTNGEYDEMTQQMIVEEEEELAEVMVYFYVIEDGMEEIKGVSRQVSFQNMEMATLNELLEGPTSQEEGEGIQTAIDEETQLISLEIEEEVAYADFTSELDVSGSAWVMLIRSQIEETLMQFESVDEVVISIEGETEDVLQP